MLAAFARGKAAKVVSGGVARLTSRTPGAVQTAVPVPTALARTTLGERLAERLAERLGAVLAAEREALPLWLPVAFAAGIAAWFVLPWAEQRLALAPPHMLFLSSCICTPLLPPSGMAPARSG
jgi:hypothetical protein